MSIDKMTMLLSFWSIRIFIMVTVYTVGAEIVDLSHDHDSNTIMAPRNPEYKSEPLYDGDIKPGVYAKAKSYSVGEHGGTHIDVPRHFDRNGMSLEKIPIEDTIADGVMVDCSKEVAKNIDYTLTVQKLKNWEEDNGQIPNRAAVVVSFNWSNKFNDSSLYFNTDQLDKPDTYRFPSVSKEAIDWLIDERDIKILVTDTASSDLFNTPFPVHVKMLKQGRLLVENIKDPGRLPTRGFRFYCTPVKFVGGTGIQVRAYAVIDGNGSPTFSACSQLSVIMGSLFTLLFSRFFCLS